MESLIRPPGTRRPTPEPRRTRARGAAAVEMALALAVLLPILSGLLEYGWMFLQSQEIASAARDGARIAATESGDNAQVTARISQIMSNAGLSSSGYSVVTVPANVASAAPGTTVQVTVSVPYLAISLTKAPFIPTPVRLDGATSMVKEGP